MTVEVGDLRGARSPDVDRERVAGAAGWALRAEGRGGANLSVTLVDDARIADLHQRYLGVSGATDVISFPLEDVGGEAVPARADELTGAEPLLGEVVVSVETAAREAAARGVSLERELLLYVIHGTLHLLGYDDGAEPARGRMERRQEELLGAFLEGQLD